MKYSFAFLLLILLHTDYLHGQNTFVYVDASGIEDRESLVTQLSNYSNLESLCFYFSNDRNPLIGSNKVDFVKSLAEFNSIRPGLPIFFVEVDSINQLMSRMPPPSVFDFYLSKNTVPNAGKELIDRVLLCSRWLNKSGTIKNIKVRIFLQEKDSRIPYDKNQLTNKGIYEIKIY